MKEKMCRACKETLPLNKDNFYSNGYTPKGSQKWKPTCKSCEALERKQATMKVITDIVGESPECQICGYNNCFSALEFHHVDPDTKEYNISTFMSSRRNMGVISKEISKCVLLCANCHREVHEGLVQVTEADLQFAE